MNARTLIGALVAAGTVLATAAGPAQAAPAVDGARAATAAYHHAHPGYELLTDAAGIACIEKEGEGGMGVHYVNGGLVADGTVDARTPELLVYEPRAHGGERLVAAEYVVFQADWDASHAEPPSLFGRDFELVEAGNRYGLPPFYELHAWLWKHNPSGFNADYNPRVRCPA